jgi:deoxycytidine triphosphate deaminase
MERNLPMSNNGKGSSRRGTSKEEMKRFEDNYDAIFRKPRKKAVAEKVEVIEIPPEHSKMFNELSEALREAIDRHNQKESETPKES